MIREIEIRNFRTFDNVKFSLGETITIISGHNATGKSTLLGLLGNCAEFKVKDGKPLLQTQFRTEFSELFNGSERFDKSGYIARISYSNIEDFSKETDYRNIRVAWQTDDKKKRFRLIPYKKDESKESGKTEAKIHWPTLYVGLSRLYPFGEVNEKNSITTNQIKLNEEENEWFIRNYKHILNIKGEIKTILCIDSSELIRKKPIGITTDTYDYMCNSAGQDNIGQILLSIISFERLKKMMEKRGENWEGGLLLIDEIDATLHPAAQNKLYEIIYKKADDLKIQVVFTTHSLTLLRHICKKMMGSNDIRKKCRVVYLSSANGPVGIEENPQYASIENDMLIQSSFDSNLLDKIAVYSEDAETRWFFKNLIEKYESKLNVLDIYLSCSDLLNIRTKDKRYFANVLMVLDSDARCKNSLCEKGNCTCKYENILILPENGKRPEQVIYDYLLNLPSDHEYLKTNKSKGITIKYIEENGPWSERYPENAKERDKFKKWFGDMERIFEDTNLFSFWKKDNKETADAFMDNFVRQYNKIAYPNLLEKIDDHDRN